MVSFRRLFLLNTTLRWKSFSRRYATPVRLLWHGTIWMSGSFVAINCIVVGYLLDIVVSGYFPQAEVVPFIETHLLSAFVLLSILRLILEQPPSLAVRPLLVLPVRRTAIVALYAFCLLTKRMNLAPLLTALAFWIKNIVPVTSGRGNAFWLCGVICIHIVFIALSVPLKLVAGDMRRWIVPVGVFVAAVTLDGGVDLYKTGSWLLGLLLCRLRNGDVLSFVGCCTAAVLAPIAATPLLKRCMNIDSH